jgi:hypothetical protein
LELGATDGVLVLVEEAPHPGGKASAFSGGTNHSRQFGVVSSPGSLASDCSTCHHLRAITGLRMGTHVA